MLATFGSLWRPDLVNTYNYKQQTIVPQAAMPHEPLVEFSSRKHMKRLMKNSTKTSTILRGQLDDFLPMIKQIGGISFQLCCAGGFNDLARILTKFNGHVVVTSVKPVCSNFINICVVNNCHS